MSNRWDTTLYIGVTNDLEVRVLQHKRKEIKGFTSRYNIEKLVYFEEYRFVEDAIAREKQLKNWKRVWKNELIEKENLNWNDLSDGWFTSKDLVE